MAEKVKAALERILNDPATSLNFKEAALRTFRNSFVIFSGFVLASGFGRYETGPFKRFGYGTMASAAFADQLLLYEKLVPSRAPDAGSPPNSPDGGY